MARYNKRTPKQRAHWRSLPPWMRAKLRESPLAKWAARIRREFEYRCVKCGSNINLEAHHIYPKHIYKNLKLDTENGIICCVECHDALHKLLSIDEDSYYAIINLLNKQRKPIKRLKSRNPSGHIYALYSHLSPDIFQVDVDNSEASPEHNKVVSKPKNSKKSK